LILAMNDRVMVDLTHTSRTVVLKCNYSGA